MISRRSCADCMMARHTSKVAMPQRPSWCTGRSSSTASYSSCSSEFREAFPDLSVTGAADFVCEGDYVVGRWEGWGTHTRPAYCDFLVGPFSVTNRRGSERLVSFAFEVTNDTFPGGPVMPGPMHQNENPHSHFSPESLPPQLTEDSNRRRA